MSLRGTQELVSSGGLTVARWRTTRTLHGLVLQRRTPSVGWSLGDSDGKVRACCQPANVQQDVV
jgi:hypothetical protein